MLTKFYQITFIFLLMLGTMIAISSSSWFISWLGLELNLMMMIPLIISSFNSNSTEASIKYFLSQAMASLIFIISSIFILFNVKFNQLNEMNMMFMMALMIKSGIPPFHFWFPQVIELSYWTQCFIILTWQKIAPFILISYLVNTSIFIYIMASCLIGVTGGFNQNSIKKILTYSSIIHSAWMMSIIMVSAMIWMKYFLIYSFISFSVIFMVVEMSTKDIMKMMMMTSDQKFKMIFMLNILSLGGLPPFLGFLAKFMVASSLISIKFSWMILIILITASLMALFFYCKMIYVSLMINSMKMKFSKKNFNKKINLIMMYVTITMNILFAPLVLLI